MVGFNWARAIFSVSDMGNTYSAGPGAASGGRFLPSHPTPTVTLGLDPYDIHTSLPPLRPRSEEHTSELQSLMRNSNAVFRLKKQNSTIHTNNVLRIPHMKPQ